MQRHRISRLPSLIGTTLRLVVLVSAAAMLLPSFATTPEASPPSASLTSPTTTTSVQLSRPDIAEPSDALGALMNPPPIPTAAPTTTSTTETTTTAPPPTTTYAPSSSIPTEGNPLISQAVEPTPTTEPAPAPTPPVGGCTLDGLIEVVLKLLEPHSIPLPSVEIGASSFYTPGTGVTFKICASLDVVAHELGHYIMQRANGSFDAHVDDAVINFCPGGPDPEGRCLSGWIRGAESYPGIEHAAHCVGNVLAGYGPYTKCPDPVMYAAALDRLRRAG